MHLRRIFAAALVAAAALMLPVAASAQGSSVPDMAQHGFPTVVASTELAAGAAGSLSFGSMHIQVPQGAFVDPVTVELLEGPLANFQAAAPAGQTVVADFALRVVDTATGQLVGTVLKPVSFRLAQNDVTSASTYDNVTPTGQIAPNPVAATVVGDVLSHPITAALVGWVVLSPSSAAATVPDLSQHGFPNVVASTKLAPGAAGSVRFGPVSVQIPAGAFRGAVKFDLLEGPISNFQAAAPAGQQVVADFALRVVDTATGQLIGTFQKPVTVTVAQSGITPASVLANVSAAGQLTPNVSAKITGSVLTLPVTSATVGAAVLIRAKTVPAATSPTTGVPILPIVGCGAVLIVAGVLLIRHARVAA